MPLDDPALVTLRVTIAERNVRTCRIPDDPLWWWSYSPKRAPPNSKSALSGIDRATPQGPTGPRSPRRRIPVGYACACSRVAFS